MLTKILAKAGGHSTCIRLRYISALRESVLLNPQGAAAVQQSLHSLTYKEVSDVREGEDTLNLQSKEYGS